MIPRSVFCMAVHVDVVAFLAARENKAAGKLSLVLLMLTAGQVAVFGYLLLTGVQAFSQAVAPLIVNFRLKEKVQQ